MKKEVIAVYLRHSSVPCWEMTEEQGIRFGALLPDYQILLCKSQEDFRDSLGYATVAISWIFRQEWFANAPNLRIIATPAAGKDYFSVVLPSHIQSWNGHFHGTLIAETAVGALLGMCRGLFIANHTLCDESWPRAELSPLQTTLRGSRILILGFGRIGQKIGQMLKPFGATICGICQHPGKKRPDWMGENDCILSSGEIDEQLALSDHVILVLPRTPETDGILDRRRLGLLPVHATVSNYGRGNAIDLVALKEALIQKRIRAAFLDVFEKEPLPADSPLLRCPNLWHFPHLSAAAPDYLDLFVEDFVQQLREFRETNEILN